MGQNNVTVETGDINNLKRGDCFKVTVLVTVPQETCESGMGQIHFYKKGIAVEYLSGWIEKQKGKWVRTISICIVGNKTNEAMLTIVKKTDKQSLFHQEQFEYTN